MSNEEKMSWVCFGMLVLSFVTGFLTARDFYRQETKDLKREINSRRSEFEV